MEDDSREEELEIDAMLEKLRQQISEVKSENRILKTGIRKAKFQLSQGRAAAKKIEFLKEVACTNSGKLSRIHKGVHFSQIHRNCFGYIESKRSLETYACARCCHCSSHVW